ncbi:hypothetical protein DXT99_17985 [Pontibacter diazotrophicus]|uniref:Uncharacterized protein n=1 Tax=Pontibacter diazotrophicus TaxID=1400979 RepID=A0A3D8L8G3_9BACT|nr:hypothetical protein [Pontibacter diazotrophicus]RDV13664.1 hypothetical protein DXT99_17985 [Pontibacter diazotrophicus]
MSDSKIELPLESRKEFIKFLYSSLEQDKIQLLALEKKLIFDPDHSHKYYNYISYYYRCVYDYINKKESIRRTEEKLKEYKDFSKSVFIKKSDPTARAERLREYRKQGKKYIFVNYERRSNPDYKPFTYKFLNHKLKDQIYIYLNSRYRLYSYPDFNSFNNDLYSSKKVAYAKELNKVKEIELEEFLQPDSFSGLGYHGYNESMLENKKTAKEILIVALQSLHRLKRLPAKFIIITG